MLLTVRRTTNLGWLCSAYCAIALFSMRFALVGPVLGCTYMHVPLPPLQPLCNASTPLQVQVQAPTPGHTSISTTVAYEALHAALICCFLGTAAVLDKVKSWRPGGCEMRL